MIPIFAPRGGREIHDDAKIAMAVYVARPMTKKISSTIR
jgi:hypothetical protein